MTSMKKYDLLLDSSIFGSTRFVTNRKELYSSKFIKTLRITVRMKILFVFASSQ